MRSPQSHLHAAVTVTLQGEVRQDMCPGYQASGQQPAHLNNWLPPEYAADWAGRERTAGTPRRKPTAHRDLRDPANWVGRTLDSRGC